jgi:hypothetical protein
VQFCKIKLDLKLIGMGTYSLTIMDRVTTEQWIWMEDIIEDLLDKGYRR